MRQRWVMMSWWPCQCVSWTSTCVASPRRMWCGWSRDGARLKTVAMLPAAGSSASRKRRSLSARSHSCSKRWRSSPVRMPACAWSWTRCVPSTRRCSASPVLWRVARSHLPRWPPPLSSPSSSRPITAPRLRRAPPRRRRRQGVRNSSVWSKLVPNNPSLILHWEDTQ